MEEVNCRLTSSTQTPRGTEDRRFITDIPKTPAHPVTSPPAREKDVRRLSSHLPILLLLCLYSPSQKACASCPCSLRGPMPATSQCCRIFLHHNPGSADWLDPGSDCTEELTQVRFSNGLIIKLNNAKTMDSKWKCIMES